MLISKNVKSVKFVGQNKKRTAAAVRFQIIYLLIATKLITLKH